MTSLYVMCFHCIQYHFDLLKMCIEFTVNKKITIPSPEQLKKTKKKKKKKKEENTDLMTYDMPMHNM